MTLTVHTARMGYRADADWLDVTYQGNKRRIEQRPEEPLGHRTIGYVFAPSPDLLYPYLAARRRGQETRELWDQYVRDYTLQMRVSYRTYRPAWQLLLSWKRAVLLCMCTDPDHCHRTVLGREILPRLGARFGGELQR